MERKKRGAPKKAANGKKAAAKTSNKRARSENGVGDDHEGVTGHLEDQVTVALPHENGATYQLDNEDVKIAKSTAPKLTEQQLLDALILPSADAPPPPPTTKPKSTSNETNNDLPSKYALLDEFFNALINVYLTLQSRKQSCTWSLMKEPMESMCNEFLHLSHLSQMQTVVPGALKLTVWKHTLTNKLGKEIVIELLEPSSFQPLNHSTSSQLRQTFHDNLIQIVKQHHTAFLTKGKKKAPKPPAQWHSQFDLESLPDIALTPLPPALTEVPSKKSTSEEKEKLDAATIEKYIEEKPIPAALAGISLATIAAAREAEEVIESESEEAKLMRRLPAIARTMHGLCVGEKKRAFPKGQLVVQLASCSAVPVSEEEVVQAMERLVKVVPQWMSVYKSESDGTEWVRFDTKVKMAECFAAIQKEGKK